VTRDERPVTFLSRYWQHDQSEFSIVIRAVAAAASRQGPVAVVTPAEPDQAGPDGAFDLIGIGTPGGSGWPDPTRLARPIALAESAAVVVDDLDDAADRLVRHEGPARLLTSLAGGTRSSFAPPHSSLKTFGPPGDRDPLTIWMHVPVNPLATQHRHNGFGFVGYILVLTDRVGPAEDPPAAVAWLTAAMHQHYVVLVENGVAEAWKGRALRGRVPVETRMDLWRLIAHARVCVDLAPGPLIARECVEALRLGTPVVVPASAPAAASHASAGGGFTFDTMADLVEGVGACVTDEGVRQERSTQGKEFADSYYGDTAAFVARVNGALRGR
jgi:hypothetical protein